jgi:hypothetical protein
MSTTDWAIFMHRKLLSCGTCPLWCPAQKRLRFLGRAPPEGLLRMLEEDLTGYVRYLTAIGRS